MRRADRAWKIARATAVGSSRLSGMAARKGLLELSAERMELEGGAAEGQSSLVGASQALGEICRLDGHPASIRCRGRGAGAGLGDRHLPGPRRRPGRPRVARPIPLTVLTGEGSIPP